MTNLVHEVRIAKTEQRPRCVRIRRFRRWRWQVTAYQPQEGQYPGVFDSRLHAWDDCGYTFTRSGALIASGRVIP